jgi:hypothetical protein
VQHELLVSRIDDQLDCYPPVVDEFCLGRLFLHRSSRMALALPRRRTGWPPRVTHPGQGTGDACWGNPPPAGPAG